MTVTVIKRGERLLRLPTHVFVSRRITDSVCTVHVFFVYKFVAGIVWFAL